MTGYIDDRARAQYLQALGEYQALWREAARGSGVQLAEVTGTPEGSRQAVELLVRMGVLEAS